MVLRHTSDVKSDLVQSCDGPYDVVVMGSRGLGLLQRYGGWSGGPCWSQGDVGDEVHTLKPANSGPQMKGQWPRAPETTPESLGVGPVPLCKPV